MRIATWNSQGKLYHYTKLVTKLSAILNKTIPM